LVISLLSFSGAVKRDVPVGSPGMDLDLALRRIGGRAFAYQVEDPAELSVGVNPGRRPLADADVQVPRRGLEVDRTGLD
jgi:hypothetical protein